MIEKVEFEPSAKQAVHTKGTKEIPAVNELTRGPGYIEDFDVTLVFCTEVNDALYASVREFAASTGLMISHIASSPNSLKLYGPASSMAYAFGTRLMTMLDKNGKKYRTREGTLQVPETIAQHLVAVLGLDNRPIARSYHRLPRGVVQPAALKAFTAVEVASLYGFPKSDGAGECIALIELGGGFTTSDLQKYFAQLSLPLPEVIAIPVGNAKNAPTGDPDGPDGEVLLDIQVAGAVAPGARIAVYFAENTDQGFVDAILAAVHDTNNKPSVISISWGGYEASWTAQAIAAMDLAFEAAADAEITVLVAAGDDGASDGGEGLNVDYPCSSVYTTACGGTTLAATGNVITSEVVWNELAQGEGASGGGYSKLFALPAWQKAKVTSSRGKRSVPDITGNADPITGYRVVVEGRSTVIGGTSGVAPLYAGLIARINALNKRPAGFINPKMYAANGVTRDITQGNNGHFAASKHYDPVSGLGVVIGTDLIKVL